MYIFIVVYFFKNMGAKNCKLAKLDSFKVTLHFTFKPNL